MGNHKKRKNAEQESNTHKKVKTNVVDNHEERLDLLTSFRQGDLCFGLHSSPKKKYFDSELGKKFKTIFANSLNYDVLPVLIGDESKRKIKNFSESQMRHYSNLHESGVLLKSGGRYKKDCERKRLSIAIRRACKFLMQGANKNQRIHFELEDVDFAITCQKPHDTSYTNSELRAAYRAEKARGPNPYLFFYHKGQPCEAPWNDTQHKAHWDDYEKQRRKPSLK